MSGRRRHATAGERDELSATVLIDGPRAALGTTARRSWPLRQQDGIEEKHEEDDGDAIGRSVDRGEGRPTASGEIYTIVESAALRLQ